ncbi:transmembrane anterior posterior transformation protein 1 homolog isoform X2 [Orbicella faveolata]|uniref:transmembrane anterior posterior transformation protein 1 homolog isoform X1 n=1 Tax=Orbicella faveolata TaxID=48498 RepID=UPI0009E4FEAB|nr:transmembrane anterior posterior transformation protein 1 homolog isoform X1 [Orbicella faveolata]XP_020624526.1 transmembrane anterior posterior transformation protein 1 homolog isoform X2 [Orbicella faveolata]
MHTAIFTLKNNMADVTEERENYNFPVPEASLDSDPEVVIRREVLDTFSTPGDEINAKLAEDFDHGLKNWTNTFDEDRESHVETVEEKASIGGNERFARQENAGTADHERVTQDETRTKSLEKDSVKSPEVEFRHRYLQQQQWQQQQEQQERLSSQNEDTRMSQSNNQSSKSMEEKLKINKKQEVPSIKETSSEDKLHDGFTKLSFMKYVMAEVFSGKLMELEEDKYTERREKVYTFMKIPREFEKLMIFGFMLCLDCFLFMFTFLPLRLIVVMYKIITGLLFCRTSRMLQPVQICDLLKGSILVACWLLLTHVDFSVLYHTVRGQSVIKLYVIYNMLEIADRLFSSFGQDILDALFWTATEPRDRRREHIGIIPHFVMAVVYVFFHAVLVLFQAICLNVAVNSHNKALLVIMVSNQFVELKGSVFKRFEKNNLFQMACSDIRERFYYIVLVSIVTLRNLTEFNWNLEHLYVICPYLLAVLSSEYFVDWIKHAFITKFNNIPVEVYCEYRALLAEDATSSRQKNAHADHFDLVSRRMGFIPLPLGSLVVREVAQSVKLHGLAGVCLLLMTFVFLTSVKVLNSIIFLGKATQYVKQKQDQEVVNTPQGNLASSRLLKSQDSVTLLDSAQSSSASLVGERRDMGPGGAGEQTKRRTKTLAEIDRYTLCSKEIVLF